MKTLFDMLGINNLNDYITFYHGSKINLVDNKITKEKLISAGFISGTDMGDGRVEYYYQIWNEYGEIERDFYIWDMNGRFMLELEWEGYGTKIPIELKNWSELEQIFFLIFRKNLPIK